MQLRNGIDPNQLKQSLKVERKKVTEHSFKAIALNWLDREIARDLAEVTIKKKIMFLVKRLFTSIGSLPIKEITPPQMLQCLKKIEAEGSFETASRVKMTASQAFKFNA